MSDHNQTLYKKIYRNYKELILSGQLEENDQLPTETQLMEMFSVSRITAKRGWTIWKRKGISVAGRAAAALSTRWRIILSPGKAISNRLLLWYPPIPTAAPF